MTHFMRGGLCTKKVCCSVEWVPAGSEGEWEALLKIKAMFQFDSQNDPKSKVKLCQLLAHVMNAIHMHLFCHTKISSLTVLRTQIC